MLVLVLALALALVLVLVLAHRAALRLPEVGGARLPVRGIASGQSLAHATFTAKIGSGISITVIGS